MNWKIIGKIVAIACFVIWAGIWYVSSSQFENSRHLPSQASITVVKDNLSSRQDQDKEGNQREGSVPKASAAGTGSLSTKDYQIGERLPLTSPEVKNKSRDSESARIQYREVTWDNLVPSDWNPLALFKGIKLDKLSDSDPRAMDALSKAKDYWKNAPPEPKMDGETIRIPGFVVSLDQEGEALKEFLLVPYFGGCIHVPPPPANQIIHVHSAHAVQGIRTMDAVWVSGTLRVQRSDTGMGAAGYFMNADNIELYKLPKGS